MDLKLNSYVCYITAGIEHDQMVPEFLIQLCWAVCKFIF